LQDRARRLATACGFAAAAIDAPGSGDRPRTEEDERFIAELRETMAAGEPVGPQVARYNAAQAERAVPEWRATLDALQAQPGLDGPVGFWGVSMGSATRVPPAPAGPRIPPPPFGPAGHANPAPGAARVPH